MAFLVYIFSRESRNGDHLSDINVISWKQKSRKMARGEMSLDLKYFDRLKVFLKIRQILGKKGYVLRLRQN